MICEKCGKQLNDDFQVCPYCGSPIQPAVNNQRFQQNQQNCSYNYGNQQMPQSGSYNYGNNPQYAKFQKGNGTIGTLALIFGIIGALLSCLYVGIVPAMAAVILGITGITQNKGRGKSIAGLVCGAIGVIISVAMIYGYESTDSDSVTSTQPKSESQYEVETQTEKKNSQKDNKIKEKSTEKNERKKFIDSCQEFDYKKIARNPDDYIGQNFKVTVQIFSKSEDSMFSDAYMKAYTDDGSGYYFDKMIYVFDEQDENSKYYVNVLENDIITVYGTFEGMEDTTNMLNGEKSKDVALHMKYAKLISDGE